MVEVELNTSDYKTILTWYELAFANKQKLNTDDVAVFNKLGVMAKTLLEEEREKVKDE
jgi:hypothetical protein